MDQEEKLCNEMERVREFKNLGEGVTAGRGCEAAVTARIRYDCVKSMECGELLYEKRFPLNVKAAVSNSYGKASNSV